MAAGPRARESREELAEAAWRCVAGEGLEGATIRGVASAAGTSTGRVVHYFRSKDELLVEALRHARRRVRRRFGARLAGLEGLATVEALALEELPLDADRRAEWRVWLAFWGRAAADPALGEELGRRLEEWRELLRGQLGRAQELGEIAPQRDVAADVERIIALVNGLGIQCIFSPDVLTPEVARRHVAALIADLRQKEPSQ